MRVGSQASRSTRSGNWLWALVLGLTLGAAFGSIQGPWWPSRSVTTPPPPAGTSAADGEQPGPRAIAPVEPLAGDALPLLEVLIASADWERLAAHRERALADRVIRRDDNAIVPVELRIGGQRAIGTARLKGDLTDHIVGDQWSLRFELQTPLRGMRRFSIQHPATRSFIMEWLAMQIARQVGLLSPRAEFVRAVVNGQQPVVYYLEEHPTKEMLEAQGRRDGPIVKFDESGLWETKLQFFSHAGEQAPPAVNRAPRLFDASETAFSERRLQRVEALDRRLMRALDQARSLRRLIIQDDLPAARIRRLQNLHRLAGKAIEDLFDTEQLGKWLALNTLINGFHGQAWHQWRFYHDPLTDRLEPMVFDTGASLLAAAPELAIQSRPVRWFVSSPRVMVAACEELGRMTSPGWVEALLDKTLPHIALVEATMRAQDIQIAGQGVGLLLDALFQGQAMKLLEQRDTVRRILLPTAAASFAATSVVIRVRDGRAVPMIEVDAWSRTTIPVRVGGFVFGNGGTVPAGTALVGLADVPDSFDDGLRLPDGGVLLPTDGSRLRFRFPADQRLLGLGQVRVIKRTIRAAARGGRPGAPEKKLPAVSVSYRPVAASEDRREQLVMRRAPVGNGLTVGRARPPALLAALDQHAFLVFDVEQHRLIVPAGRHVVRGDLLLPENQVLHLLPGAELALAPDAVVVVGAMVAIGEADAPIRIGPTDEQAGFAGVLVLGTAGPSELAFVEVRRAGEIQRGAWQTTGGVTFVGAAITLRNCQFKAARGEDALNVVGVRLHCQGCTFAGGQSDLLDGDFVNGTITDCRFLDSGGDALDVSGSSLIVRGCHFERIGDKALSIGEGSRLEVYSCHVHGAMIAISSKDRSTVVADDLTVDDVDRFVAVVYIKKPEFGAAALTLQNLHWGGQTPPAYLVQTGCALAVDGVDVATQDLDVEALYRDKILGK